MIRIAEPLPSDDGPYEYRFNNSALEFTGCLDDTAAFELRQPAGSIRRLACG